MPAAKERRHSPGRAQTEGYVVFISYAARDRWIASVLGEKVSAVGGEPWLDVESLQDGCPVVSGILEGVWGCHEAIVLVTRASVGSQWVSFELGAARALGKPITPVFYGVDPAQLKPASDLKCIDLNDFEAFVKELAVRIRRFEEH